jgi:hypothetical protein
LGLFSSHWGKKMVFSIEKKKVAAAQEAGEEVEP